MQNSSESGKWMNLVRSGIAGSAFGSAIGSAFGPVSDTASGRVEGFRNRRILFTLAGLFLFFFWLFRPGDPAPEVTLPAAIPELTFPVEQADEAIRQSELEAGPLRPDNHARIIWNPEFRDRKAPCSMVYLHGFSSSYGEGAPVHARVARDLGCHLYVSRLHAHGLRTEEPLGDFRADSLLVSAAHALAVGNLLGEKVILIGNSMGGTLALHLASEHPDAVDILILLAPLIGFDTAASYLFDRTWGRRLMRLFLRGPYLHVEPDNDDHARYWYDRYHIEALGTLKTMVRNVLEDDEIYANIHQPVFAGYFYKDDGEKDDVISVRAIREIEEKLGTPPAHREFIAFPDADAHVISSAYRTTGHEPVRKAIVLFLESHTDQ